jgi:uncharacterized protein (TIGR03663 family)
VSGVPQDGGMPAPGLAARSVPWLLLGLAAALRLSRLDVRPLHHDEGTNVIFLLRLMREGTYEYDPSNYHGPLLYFLSVVPFLLFGTSTVTLRIVPALLGTLMAPLPWLLRRDLGRAGAIAAGVLLAVSPSMVYYSRDNIHEIYLVFLTLALVTAALRGAASGRIAPFALAGMAAGGMVATKETAGLTFLALAAGLALSRGAGLSRPRRAAALTSLGVACLVAVALYSDLFTDFNGLRRSLDAIRLWGARGLHADGHAKPWWYFVGILRREEPAILTAGLAGAALALWRRDRFGMFLAGWAGAILLAYSSIPYKTPWLILNSVLPLALLGGWAVQAFADGRPTAADARPAGRARWLVIVLLAAGALLSARRAYEVSFARYDDDRASQLVYVQTRRDVRRLVSRIEEFASRRPEGRGVSIEILSPDYLPLNWYLRDFTAVGYFGTVIDSPGAPIVIARADSADRVAGLLGPGYTQATYPLRPGVDLVLFLQERPAETRPAGGPPAPGRL